MTTIWEKKISMVLGDSMVKHIQGWGITKKPENKHKVYIRPFAGLKVICMNDICEKNTDHIIFHVGTNDIPTSKDSLAIVQSIVDLAKSVMTQDRSVTISGIIPQNNQWNNKVREVMIVQLARVKMIFDSLTIIDQFILEKISIKVNYI